MIKPTNMSEYLQAAIKASEMRQSAIAENIANVDTPGYRRKVVEFEKQLAEAIDSSGKVDPEKLKIEFSRLTGASASVQLEKEIGDLIRNSAATKTYMRLLSKLYRQMELAMQG